MSKCKFCHEEIKSQDRPEYVDFRYGKYITAYSGGSGPYHKGCAITVTKLKNANARG